MKKLVLFFLFFLLLSTSCQPQKGIADNKTKQKSSAETLKARVTQKDTARVIIDSILYGRQEIKINDEFKNSLTTAIQESSEKDDLDKWAFALQVFVLIVALVAILPAWKSYIATRNTLNTTNKSLDATNKSLDRDKRYKDLAFLSEINKLTVENPEVAAYNDAKKDSFLSQLEVINPVSIRVKGKEKLVFNSDYDFDITPAATTAVRVYKNSGTPTEVPIGAGGKNFKGLVNDQIIIEGAALLSFNGNATVLLQSIEDKMLNEKITAFCYYKLNNFELALKEQDLNKDSLEAWENYFVHTIKTSTRFRDLVKMALNDVEHTKIFSAKFRTQMTDILARHNITL